jgi:signal peptidase II
MQLGYVVDFLYFHWKTAFYWPAFNVADSSIVVGVGLLLCHSFMVGKNPSKEVKPQPGVSGKLQ